MEDALARELWEEVGLSTQTVTPRFLHRYVLQNDVESELVTTFACQAEGPFRRQEAEIEALRFWSRPAIERALGTGVFSPNFEDEYARLVRAGGEAGI